MGARTAEGLSSCSLAGYLSPGGLPISTDLSFLTTWQPQVVRCFRASISAPKAIAASTLMMWPQKSLLRHCVGYK